jgi:hypothetical protein
MTPGPFLRRSPSREHCTTTTAWKPECWPNDAHWRFTPICVIRQLNSEARLRLRSGTVFAITSLYSDRAGTPSERVADKEVVRT